MTTVDTKSAPRRDLDFQDMEAVLADLDRLEAAERAGTLIQNGNWTLGQNAAHLGDFIEQSYDGFRFKAPVVLRLLFTALKPVILGRPFPSGVKLRGQLQTLLPQDGVTTEEGLGLLREQIGRIQQGEQITRPSPLFGKLRHEQWVMLHRNHANLHLSYLDPGGA